MKSAPAINEIFDRVVVVSLARRPDRWRDVTAELAAAGIRHHRVFAVDGKREDVAAEWSAYARQPLAVAPEGAARITTTRDFWRGNHPPEARLAWFEGREGRKAITTPGAWGLLRSMTALVEDAIASGVESLLIFEDDVRLHCDFGARWAKAFEQLPPDWAILQFGAMQLHLDEGWIDWYSENLYRCGGSSLAAHAVGLRAEVLPSLLAACRRRDMPFDVGALNEVKRMVSNRCFTIYPNLAIQDGADSEIGSSRIFEREIRKEDNVYRWRLQDYGLAARGPLDAGAPKYRPPDSTPGMPGPVLLVLLVGLSDDAFVKAVALLVAQREREGIVPVVVTDRTDFRLLRTHNVPFEHLRLPESGAKLAPDLDWDTRLLRHLRALRLKWRPVRIVPFGAWSGEILELWRKSPLEAASPGPDLGTDDEGPGR